MPSHTNTNRPETPLPIDWLNGYIEQIDRIEPSFVKASQDYCQACLSALGMVRKNVLDVVARTGHEPPFVHTAADATAAAVSGTIKLQGNLALAGLKAHRQAMIVVRDTLVRKQSD